MKKEGSPISTSGQGIESMPPVNSSLIVEGDPTSWGLYETYTAGSLPGPAGDEPRALSVATPLFGWLLLAPRRAGTLVVGGLRPQHPTGGWIPCLRLPAPYLYLPSPAGVSLATPTPGYMLAPDTDLAALKDQILDAMRGDGSPLSVSTNNAGIPGTVFLDGSRLPFVVLAKLEET